jgi:hypothetical protein
MKRMFLDKPANNYLSAVTAWVIIQKKKGEKEIENSNYNIGLGFA